MQSSTISSRCGALWHGIALAPSDADSKEIELHDISRTHGAPVPRVREHESGKNFVTRLIDRVCKDLSSRIHAAIRNTFGEARPAKAERNHAPVHKAQPRRDVHRSGRRLATLKEALELHHNGRVTRRQVLNRINFLQFRGGLAEQLNNLTLRELRQLWQLANIGGAGFLSSEARETFCEIGYHKLCRAFKAEAARHGNNANAGSRELPTWAAKAPAEWQPKEALIQAYCVE